jgi:cytochrome bd ubiquinol oxidase subunit II
MDINTFWLALIAILFAGFFFLEGFDYGVGILLPFLCKRDNSRRLIINSIGSVWDGNEVWLIAAGGAIFAAFPEWYATMFSGFYFALILILFGLALRGVSFEFRGKSNYRRWRIFWDGTFFLGSFILALVWGIFVGNLIRGVPIGSNMQYVGNFGDLLNAYSILVGIMFVMLFTLHGSAFLRLKLDPKHYVSQRLNRRLGGIHIVTVVIYFIFIIATCWESKILSNIPALIISVLSFLSLIAAGIKIKKAQKRTFIFTGITVILITFCLFVLNYPTVLISTINPAYSLTIYNSSTCLYSMQIMRIVALIFVPLVLIYQGFSYWIFRKRLTNKDLEY